MRKMLLVFPGLLALASALGQKTELAVSLNSGLFSFAGRSATGSSFINYSNEAGSGYTNDPYGSRPAFCYGLSADLKKVTRRNILLGLSGGYEVLRSKVAIGVVDDFTGNVIIHFPASGQTFLNSSFLNLFPNIGYRFRPGEVSLDVTGGIDLAYCLSAMEKGDVTANGTKYSSSRDRKTITADIRPRLQISAGYHKTGVYIGYSYGLVNYTAGYVGGANGCYARLIRFGLFYRLI